MPSSVLQIPTKSSGTLVHASLCDAAHYTAGPVERSPCGAPWILSTGNIGGLLTEHCLSHK